MTFNLNGKFENKKMQSSNSNQNIRSNHPEWYLLADYALSDIMPDNGEGDKLMAGFLSQPFHALGVPPEWIVKIEMALTGFVKKELVPIKQGWLERSRSIRIFCYKKVIDDANSAKTSRPDHAEQTMEPTPIVYHSGTIMSGGWGYFIIGRSGDDAGSPERSCQLIDLYLYKEGE